MPSHFFKIACLTLALLHGEGHAQETDASPIERLEQPLRIGDEDVEIPLGDIERGNLVYRWERGQKR